MGNQHAAKPQHNVSESKARGKNGGAGPIVLGKRQSAKPYGNCMEIREKWRIQEPLKKCEGKRKNYNPENPDNPDNPDNPENPANPENPDNPNNPNP